MIKSLLVATILTFTGAAFGQSSISAPGLERNKTITFIQYMHVTGEETIPLRTLVQRRLQSQGEQLRDYQLAGVSLYAKSWAGLGVATLRVGLSQSSGMIPHPNGSFHSEHPATFNRMVWDLRPQLADSNQAWQMHLRGNVKVDAFQVHLSPRYLTERIRIPMGDAFYTGQNTIHLRNELRRLGYDVGNARLKRVTLVAKSLAGQGQAELRIGPTKKLSMPVFGSQLGYPFESSAAQSYHQISWQHNGPTPGAWQIDMRGNVKVKAIIVELN